ncbi:MAG: signal peptidase I [Phycisphaerae bacterium]|nr:signal peptidase I [Phycisphaerae bacterium]NIP50872.1 signal peptidase I [Phycisphaerae bacterium]NIS54743.1 signal peptidase I [Phycisphaerae bacterium]NIU12343.1 signal peptidase I [Phycisphaerae bacterium]NIU60232.1 signal peptidase I [Phycisphaerae bacterium]
MVVFLIIALIQIISMGIVFDKAGQPGWAVIVPFYNMWVLAEVGDKPGWMGLVMCFCSFIPVIGIILYWVLLITISIGVAKTFERGVGFGIGLSFLPFIFFPILAFSRD